MSHSPWLEWRQSSGQPKEPCIEDGGAFESLVGVARIGKGLNCLQE